MSLTEIQAAIPHRPPFLFVDEIVVQSDTAITCRKTFHAGEHFFAGHYPDYPLVPGVLLCEAAMQAGAVLLSKFAKAARVPVVTRMSDVRFKRMVRPGETIEMAIDLLESRGGAYFMGARVTCDGKIALRFEFVCMMVERQNDETGTG